MPDENKAVPDPGQLEGDVVSEDTVVETETTEVSASEPVVTETETAEPAVEETVIEPGSAVLPPTVVTERHETWLSRFHHEHSWVIPTIVAGILVIVLVPICANFLMGFLAKEAAENPAPSRPAVPATSTVTTETPEPPPFDEKGAKSFTEWMAKANAQKDEGKLGMWKAMADLHFDGKLKWAYGGVRYQVYREAEHGLDYYVRTVPAGGLAIDNTSPKGKSYLLLENRTLKPGDTYLVFDEDNPFVGGKKATSPTDKGKEIPAVRRACGNPIKITKPKPPEKCTNNTNQYQEHAKQDPSTNVGPTDGYEQGNAEQVVQNQNNNGSGSDQHTTNGTAGTGSGGTTLGGSGEGTAVPNPGAGETIGGTVPDN